MKTAGKILVALLAMIFTVSCAVTTMFASPTPIPSPTPTETPRPTSTETPAPTRTPSLSLDCGSQETWSYTAKSTVIWQELWELDASTMPNYDEATGQLLSTEGFEEISQRVSELAKMHADLQVPPLFATYNGFAVKALEAYAKGILETSLGNESTANFNLIDFNYYWGQADIEWFRIAEYCQWPTPTPLPVSS